MTKYQSIVEDFAHAVTRLEEILKEPKTIIVRDSAIKRFELAFDLAWKTTKARLEEEHNVTCVSPRSCFREAFRVGLIQYDERWLQTTSARNYTAHAYKEALAEKIYTALPNVLALFQTLLIALKREDDKV